MNSVEIWTYVGYAIAVIFLLLSLGMGLMMYVSSQEEKKNPIALPSKKVDPKTVEEKDIFESDHFTKKNERSEKGKTMPIMHNPVKRSSRNFFDDDDEGFSITKGGGK